MYELRHWWVDLQDDGYHDIDLDQNDGDPEADEKAAHPDPRVLLDVHVHVHCDEPIVDYHLAEECDQSTPIVIKVHQIVELESVGLLKCLEGQVSGEKYQTELCVTVEYQVDEEELAKDRLWDVLGRFHYHAHCLCLYQ